jgi:vacuolar-type H+-ATPase subunit H
MMEKHLDLVRAKEEEARSSVAAAAARSADIVEQARRDGEAHLDEVRAEAAERERSSLAAARRAADERSSTMRAENAKRLAALAVLARKNEERVIETIVKEFRAGA